MTHDVLFAEEGHLGCITLNRPDALHALTLPMIQAMQQQLTLWKHAAHIHAVVLRAEPARAFCAGGDVRWLYQAGKSHNPKQMDFFWHEYRLNYFIHHFGKPYIALMDGVTLGGGVGISMHGSHPVASPRFAFAMPETSIGFFPDIGASHLLARCPGSLGVFLGLTGNRLGAYDALSAGIVEQVVPSEAMTDLVAALLEEDLSKDAHARVRRCIQAFAVPIPQVENTLPLAEVDACFCPPTVELISKALVDSGSDWALATHALLEKKAPLSLKVTLAQLQKARGRSLAECLVMDFDLVGHFMQDSDFYEGVRAVLIDKDQNPHWSPERLDLVSDALVARYFEPQSRRLGLGE